MSAARVLAVESEADLLLALRAQTEAALSGRAVGGAAVLYVASSGCRPCARFQPHYERLADAHPGVRFMRVDPAAGPAAAALCAERIGVEATPSFVFYVRGAEVARMRGADLTRFEAHLADAVRVAMAKQPPAAAADGASCAPLGSRSIAHAV